MVVHVLLFVEYCNRKAPQLPFCWSERGMYVMKSTLFDEPRSQVAVTVPPFARALPLP